MTRRPRNAGPRSSTITDITSGSVPEQTAPFDVEHRHDARHHQPDRARLAPVAHHPSARTRPWQPPRGRGLGSDPLYPRRTTRQAGRPESVGDPTAVAGGLPSSKRHAPRRTCRSICAYTGTQRRPGARSVSQGSASRPRPWTMSSIVARTSGRSRRNDIDKHGVYAPLVPRRTRRRTSIGLRVARAPRCRTA